MLKHYTFADDFCQNIERIDRYGHTRYNPRNILVPKSYRRLRKNRTGLDSEKRSRMLNYAIAAGGTSVWGILLLVIIFVALVPNFLHRRKGSKIAMCQVFVLDGDREGNLLRIENAIAEATGKGATILCFAESAIMGWLNPEAHNRAYPIPGEDSERLCELAEKYKVHLCVGLAEKEGNRLYNSAILIDDQGNILLKHREMNIPSTLMEPPYTPGSDLGTADTKFGKIGLLICSETHHKDILERMADLKPALVLVPYGYAEQELKWPDHGRELMQLIANTAMRTGATVIGTNLLGQITKGPWAGRVYGGQSAAADKSGKILAIAKDRDRDIHVLSV